MELFVDDTNASIANEEESIKEFWECLNIFCKASSSAVNHKKMGIICKGNGSHNGIMRLDVEDFKKERFFGCLVLQLDIKCLYSKDGNG